MKQFQKKTVNKRVNQFRSEYKALWYPYKEKDIERWRWQMSNSRYILYLENKLIYSQAPQIVHLAYFFDPFGPKNQEPYITAHKTMDGAYRSIRRYLVKTYNKWWDMRMIEGKKKHRFHPTFDNCHKIITFEVKP